MSNKKQEGVDRKEISSHSPSVVRLRSSLRKFAENMEKTLQENDYKGGWSDCSLNNLYGMLENELKELRSELENADVFSPSSHPQGGFTITGDIDADEEIINNIKKECCDVANFAMMIFDNV